jgi:hypothetical protein
MRCRARCAAVLQAPLQYLAGQPPARTSVDWFSAVLPDDRAGSGVRPRVAEGPRRSSGGPPVGQRMLVTRPVRAGPAAATPCGATGGLARPSSAPISALSPPPMRPSRSAAAKGRLVEPGLRVAGVGAPVLDRGDPAAFWAAGDGLPWPAMPTRSRTRNCCG